MAASASNTSKATAAAAAAAGGPTSSSSLSPFRPTARRASSALNTAAGPPPPPSSFSGRTVGGGEGGGSGSRPLRRGPCNFRDLTLGHKCGCTTFWGDDNNDNRVLLGVVLPQSQVADRQQQEVHWCVCGHHACYHHLVETAASGGRAGTRLPTGQIATARMVDNGVYLQFGSKSQSQASSKQLPESEVGKEGFGVASLGAAAAGLAQGGRQHSLPSTMSLPPVPSVCLLDSQELRPIEEAVARPPGSPAPRDSLPSAGLGLTLNPYSPDQFLYGQGSTKANDSQSRFSAAASASDVGLRSSPSRAFMQSIMDRRLAMPALDVPQDTLPDPVNQEDAAISATEVATPSLANTPDLRTIEQTVGEARSLADWLALSLMESPKRPASQSQTAHMAAPSSLPQLQRDNAGPLTTHAPSRFLTASPVISQDGLGGSVKSIRSALSKLSAHLGTLQSSVSAYPSVSESISNLMERVGRLEGLSFSYVHPDVLEERFEHFEGRLLDLEGWRDEHERHHVALDADTSSRDHSLKAEGNGNGPTRSLAPDGSRKASSAFASVGREEIDDIKERLHDLETALPSMSGPWDVEVVLLPWGPELKGVWFIPDESDSWKMSVQDTEEWTQSRSLMSSRGSAPLMSSFHSGWSNEDIAGWADHTTEWLWPRACGTKNLAYKRLRSRGFVRNVKITGHNAGDIQAALAQCFESLSDVLRSPSGYGSEDGDDTEDAIANELLGLRASFIPLRKAIRSSRLRFLSRSELATSALWSAQFLASGVMMRVSGGVKRLYVTQGQAYLQQNSKYDGWTWQRIRELPRVRLEDDDDQELAVDDKSNTVAEADGREACWEYCPGLDQPISIPSSLSSSHSKSASDHAAAPASPVQQSLRVVKTPRQSQQGLHSRSGSYAKQPITPLSEFPPSRRRQRRARTASASIGDDGIGSRQRTSQQPARRSWSGKRVLTSSFDETSNSTSARQTLSTVPLSTKPVKRRRLASSPDREGYTSPMEEYAGPYAQYDLVSDDDDNTTTDKSLDNDDDDEDDDGSDVDGDEAAEDDDEDDDDESPNSVTFTSRHAYNFTPRRSKEPGSPFFTDLGGSSSAAAAKIPPSGPNAAANPTMAHAAVPAGAAAAAAVGAPEPRKVSNGSTSTGYTSGPAAGPGKSTPFAYATPHSGMAFGNAARGQFPHDDGDTEIDEGSSSGGGEGDSGDEWDGLGEAGSEFGDDDGFAYGDEDDRGGSQEVEMGEVESRDDGLGTMRRE